MLCGAAAAPVRRAAVLLQVWVEKVAESLERYATRQDLQQAVAATAAAAREGSAAASARAEEVAQHVAAAQVRPGVAWGCGMACVGVP